MLNLLNEFPTKLFNFEVVSIIRNNSNYNYMEHKSSVWPREQARPYQIIMDMWQQ